MSSKKSFLFIGYSLAFALGLGITRMSFGSVTMPNIFGDHMVLQQNQKIEIWGWALPDEKITVNLEGQTAQTVASKTGTWRVTLPPRTADGKSLVMTVMGSNTIEFKDIKMGEVWLCSGQSNMAWPLSNAFDADLDTLTAKFPDIRLISVPQVGTQEQQKDFKGNWELCTPDSAKSFSAVGFYFGRQLHQVLDVPVGLIDNAWGGSACEAWIARDLLSKDQRYDELLDRWKDIETNYDFDKQVAQYNAKLVKWKTASKKARDNGKTIPRRPRAPRNQLTGQHRPGNLYNGVLKPIIGFPIQGVIWYQGEANSGRAYQYRDLFPLMIQNWRDEWGIGDFAFYWVQLADFMEEGEEPAESNWAELREAQTMTLSKLPNTGQAVIIDIGESNNIHPRNKHDVGKRLARWALAEQYGVKIAYRSPSYHSMIIQDSKIIVTFDHVGTGLKGHDYKEVKGFTIAADNGEFVNAQARILGKDRVEVWSDQITKPKAVRYAWANNPICNLKSMGGLPATPFRTDDRPGLTINSKK